MSAQPQVVVPPISDQQATAILQEALNRGMMEGTMPLDEATRLSYANSLVAQAKQAAAVGNQEENVITILFLAEVDQQPPPVPIAPPVPAAPAPSNDNFDFTTLSDDVIAGMITTLQGAEYANIPTVQAEIAQLQAEQIRRSGGQVAQTPQPQAVAPPAQAPPAGVSAAIPVPPGASSAPSVPVAAPSANPTPAPAAPGQAIPPGTPTPQPAGIALGVAIPDATPPAGVQVAQPSAQAPAATDEDQPSAQDGERDSLTNQVSIAALRAHNVDISEVPNLSIESLRTIVENPGGPVASSTTSTPAPGDQPAISSEREQLVEQITGSMLKAYGRGRRDIPGIGDNEIKLMIANPDGKVDPAQFTAARESDRAAADGEAPPAVAPPAQPAPVAAPAVVVSPVQPPAAPPAVPAPVASAVPPVAVHPAMAPPAPSAFAPPPAADQSAPVTAPTPLAATFPVPTIGSQAFAAPVPAAIAPPAGAAPPIAGGTAQEQAMAIITAENMPIPPEIDGEPPRLPNDLSKVSDEELFSFHARFHACEVRMNWIITQYDDQLGDIKKLLRNARREALLAVPATVDGKKATKDMKEAQAESDPNVQQYLGQLEEIEKVVGKLKVLRDGYHQDVSTCSRQYSMRSGEADKQPR